MHIRFNKVVEFIRIYDETRYLVLFCPEKYDAIYNRTGYLISQNSNIMYNFSYNYARIKILLYGSLPWKE